MTHAFKTAVVATLCVVAITSGTNAADRGKDSNRDRNRTEIWKNQRDSENGCAIGNTPPPGANCTNRDDRTK